METIGAILKAAREKRKMSRENVAKATRLKTLYIEAIEKNEFHKLIAPIYAKGFIKLYAQCVQINPAPLLRQFIASEASPQPAPAGQKLPDKKEAVSKKSHWNINIIYANLLGAFKKIKLPDKKEAVSKKPLWNINIIYANLLGAFKKIKLPDIRQIRIPAFKPIEMPVKKLLMITATAVICVIILSVFVKKIVASNARLKVPQSCRWIADPPEPYINIPIQKSTNSR